MSDLVVFDVVLGEDLDAVGVLYRAGKIDLVDPRAGVLRIQALGVQHAVKIQIVGKEPRAVDLLLRVDPLGIFVHVEGRGGLGELTLFAEVIRREQDRVLDLLVAGTAAEIALDGFLDVSACRVEGFIQQRLCRDDHARDAEAALYRARFSKAVLIDAHLPGVDALDGQHLFAL